MGGVRYNQMTYIGLLANTESIHPLMSKFSSPADLARMALLRLAELKLPPTPENYSKFYYEIAGASQPKSSGSDSLPLVSPETVAACRTAIGGATAATENLVEVLDDTGSDIAGSLADLIEVQQQPEQCRPLIEAIVQHTSLLSREVKALTLN